MQHSIIWSLITSKTLRCSRLHVIAKNQMRRNDYHRPLSLPHRPPENTFFIPKLIQFSVISVGMILIPTFRKIVTHEKIPAR